MTREEVKGIIFLEGLKGYNFFEPNVHRENEIVITYDSKQWIVYATDERASARTGSHVVFDSEEEALNNFLKRLRIHNS